MLAVESSGTRGVLDIGGEEWQHWGRFGESAELLYREINAALIARHSLGVADVHLLNLLNADSRRHVRMGALADALVVSPSRVTWQVGRLEERGLARRFRSRDDKRGVAVGITRHGQEHLRPALRTYAMLVRQFYLAPLNREQMIALGDCARRVSDALKSDGAVTP
ncbi:MarR family winged helix-turn-helix transcriptional regulator [Mycolicibacterium peregrinum]|uniref:MarR family winged helix-turn-helix transcriptional regulator n=1 Tax=Mycolicibacterium peregrinum TaxID=43304 RepID=UPI003AAEBF3A